MHPVNPPIIRRLISITISMALRHPKTTTKSPSTTTVNHRSPSPIPTASDALPLPLYLTNAIFLTLFFSVAYFLLHRWRFKIRSQTPLHVITGAELAAIGTLIASFIYLLGFFGIGFVQSVIATSRSDDDNDIDNFEDDAVIRNKRKPNPTIMNRLNHVAENDAVVSSKRKPNPSLRIMNALNHLNELNPVAEDVAVVSSKRKPNASLRIMNNLIRLNELNELNHVSEDDVDEDDDDVVTLVHSEHKPNLRIMNNLNELNELNLLNAVLEDEDEKDNLTLEDEAIVRNKYKPNSSLRIMKNNLLKLNQLNPVSKDENEKLTLEDDAVVRNKYKPNSSLRIMKNNLNELSEEDEEVVKLVVSGIIPSYSLETKLGDCRRAASIRREAVERKTGRSMVGLPLEGFDYESILGRCCEMPIGYVQLPVGIAGPLLLNGGEYMVPMATTEGCLVASTNRGCKAVFGSGGATAVLLKDGMTRAPVVRFGTAARAAQLKFFLEDGINFETLNIVFNKSSRFARLQTIQCSIAGRNLYIRFTCSTGDAMGMNMVSKGVQNVLDFLHIDFPDMDVIGISGNFCSDKKPAAVNWIEGRGKSVVCEAVITEEVVRKVLKTTVPALVELNMLKNLAGSAVAGSLGGFNAHASNIVSAIFIATGQDPAQNIESSHCITMMEAVNGGKDLHVSVTMPSIEVGTVGGGTQLASQAACLNLLGVKGGSKESPGSNARLLATIVAGSVLAGELSLMSAISEGQLVKSHMKYNRSNHDMTAIASS